MAFARSWWATIKWIRSLWNLQDRAKLVRDGLDKLHQAFTEHCDNLQGKVLVGQWHNLQAVLTVPFIEPALRWKLLENSKTISTKLFEGYDPTRVAEAGHSENPAEGARRQGLLAMAVLGRPWINQQKQNNKTGLAHDDLRSLPARRTRMVAAAPGCGRASGQTLAAVASAD